MQAARMTKLVECIDSNSIGEVDQGACRPDHHGAVVATERCDMRRMLLLHSSLPIWIANKDRIAARSAPPGAAAFAWSTAG